MGEYATYNDREFICTMNSCGYSDGSLQYGSAYGRNMIDLDLRMLDVDRMRESLRHILQVTEAQYQYLLDWISNSESAFARDFALSGAKADARLFNTLNVVIAQLKKNRGLLSGWLTQFRETATQLQGALNDYDSEAATLASMQMSTTVLGGLTPDSVQLAKQHQSRLKATQRRLMNIMKRGNRIKLLMNDLQTQINEFNAGVVSVDGQLLDFRDFERLIQSLRPTESPLVRIQQNIAEMINSSETRFVLASLNLRPLNLPEGPGQVVAAPALPTRFVERFRAAEPDWTETQQNLQRISEEMVYTESAQRRLEPVFADILRQSEGNLAEGVLRSLVDRIRANTPQVVLDSIREQFEAGPSMFGLRERVIQILRNLDNSESGVRALFRMLLEEIETYTREVLAQDMGAPMDVSVPVEPGFVSGASGAADVTMDSPSDMAAASPSDMAAASPSDMAASSVASGTPGASQTRDDPNRLNRGTGAFPKRARLDRPQSAGSRQTTSGFEEPNSFSSTRGSRSQGSSTRLPTFGQRMSQWELPEIPEVSAQTGTSISGTQSQLQPQLSESQLTGTQFTGTQSTVTQLPPSEDLKLIDFSDDATAFSAPAQQPPTAARQADQTPTNEPPTQEVRHFSLFAPPVAAPRTRTAI